MIIGENIAIFVVRPVVADGNFAGPEPPIIDDGTTDDTPSIIFLYLTYIFIHLQTLNSKHH